jgi:hypothetical protein
MSLNQDTWTNVGSAQVDPATGHFTIVTKSLQAGDAYFRVKAQESDTASAGESKGAHAVVEDYQAAGREYLRIVKIGNDLLSDTNAAFESNNLARINAASARFSRAMTQESRGFQRYDSWPKSVQPDIASLARGCLLDADYYNSMARANSIDVVNAVESPEYPKGYENAPVLIRAALGLPKREG